jgi:spoIIIJ-associated protein
MDTQDIQRAQQWLEKLLSHLGTPASVTNIQSTEGAERTEWLVIDETQLQAEQIKLLLGDQGQTLDAIQYLANSILNIGQTEDHKGAFTIELAGYRLRRFAELDAIAQEAADKARSSGAEIELKALSAAERRHVHNFLKEFEDLETFSRGQEPDRRLVVHRQEPMPE